MSVYVASALAIAVVMLGTWLLSLVLRNASIVDIVWGLGFVVVAWVSYLTADETGSRQNVLLVLVSLWGVRLGAYLLWNPRWSRRAEPVRRGRRRSGSRRCATSRPAGPLRCSAPVREIGPRDRCTTCARPRRRFDPGPSWQCRRDSSAGSPRTARSPAAAPARPTASSFARWPPAQLDSCRPVSRTHAKRASR